MADEASARSGTHADASSSSSREQQRVAPSSNHRQQRSRATVDLHGTPVPLDWLVVSREAYPASALATPAAQRRSHRDVKWAMSREQLLAASAAGVHVALFAYNLMFWGFDGMPQDRYWPSNPRLKLQIRPGRYGNLEGSRRFYFDNLARLEGVE